MGGSSGGSGACCPPTPSCPQANQCSSSYVSPPSSGPASYPIPPSSYAQQPQQYAQPAVAAAVHPPPSPKYPTAGK
ncbi:hypothetical protein GCK72_002239 [Caenorhabditis remanei]|uniref:Uncharacterized protein n=2 Tax=Caenorhabditis remanei TaxID=31234 RepID=A0A6A5HTG9_CAERE|nr:hypothetical protein GCK72_002239 [Caenorhabditis remanei]KAF1770421.1 hypothetical protein GCK72_002239 [Caenorhabditis remanei]